MWFISLYIIYILTFVLKYVSVRFESSDKSIILRLSTDLYNLLRKQSRSLPGKQLTLQEVRGYSLDMPADPRYPWYIPYMPPLPLILPWYASTNLDIPPQNLICQHKPWYANTNLDRLPQTLICQHKPWYANTNLDMPPQTLLCQHKPWYASTNLDMATTNLDMPTQTLICQHKPWYLSTNSKRQWFLKYIAIYEHFLVYFTFMI